MSAQAISIAVRPERGGLAVRTGVVMYALPLVALPMAALVHHGLSGGIDVMRAALSSPAAIDAFWLTVWTAAVMAVINAVMGTATAWVLVRYRFPGRGLLSALVDLPFAIPTLVTGLMLVILFGPQSALGGWFSSLGFQVVFAPPAIVLALLFVTMPFVVRAVEPVLLELDPAEEEASYTLGASNVTTFFKVILPAILPTVLSGTVRSFAKALGEFGSIVVVSGNIPHRTLTAPVFVFGEIESGSSQTAAAVSLLLLAFAVGLLILARRLEQRVGGRHA